MKSKLKYYAQVIGVNLLAFLAPVLAVVLIYGFGKLKNICSHPCVLSQEIYDFCLEATIVVLAGFFVGFWLLNWADSWRKEKLRVQKSRKEREELELHVKFEVVEPIEERTEQKNIPASDDPEFEDISGLTAKEIWHLYRGRKVYVEDPNDGNSIMPTGTLAGYDSDSATLFVGFADDYHCYYDSILDNMDFTKDWVIMRGFKSYGEFELSDVYIIK